jgi:integrase
LDKSIAYLAVFRYGFSMSAITDRKYIKTKFEGVFYRLSPKRDPLTGEADKVYCFWYADPLGKGHWKTVGRHSKGVRPTTARNMRAKFLSDMAETGVNPVDFSSVTVGQTVDAYTQWAESENKNISKLHCLYALHLKGRIHNTPIADITPGLLSSLKGALMKSPLARSKKGKNAKSLSDQSVNMILSYVRAAVNRAIGTGMWKGVNPLSTKRGGPWQMLKLNNARLRFFTPDEAKKLLAELERRNPQLRDMALLSLRTGLRATEIFKLTGQDVDAAADVLYIIAKGGSRAAVRVPTDIAAMLREYGRAPGEPLFKTPVTGKPFTITPPCFGKAVKRLNLAAVDGNTLYAVTFHTFRHTFASWLAQSGKVTLFELKNLMRHKNINMTLRYAHLFPGQESEKLSIIDGLLA